MRIFRCVKVVLPHQTGIDVPALFGHANNTRSPEECRCHRRYRDGDQRRIGSSTAATANAALAISHMMWTERRPYDGGTKTTRSASRTCSSCGLLPLTAEQRLGRRRLLLRVATFLPAKELLLDLQRDSIQPFLCSVRPVLVIPDRTFKLAYPVFCRTQLRRQLMSHFKSLLVLCIGSGRCAVNQSQNRLGCLVDAIRGFRSAVWLWRELNDCLCGDLPTITHSHPPHDCLTHEFHHSRLFEAIHRLWITCLCR